MTRLLTASEVADLLAVSERFVYDHAHELGLVKLGRASRFDPDAVERYIEARRVATSGYASKRPARVESRSTARRGTPGRRPMVAPVAGLLPEGR